MHVCSWIFPASGFSHSYNNEPTKSMQQYTNGELADMHIAYDMPERSGQAAEWISWECLHVYIEIRVITVHSEETDEVRLSSFNVFGRYGKKCVRCSRELSSCECAFLCLFLKSASLQCTTYIERQILIRFSSLKISITAS